MPDNQPEPLAARIARVRNWHSGNAITVTGVADIHAYMAAETVAVCDLAEDELVGTAAESVELVKPVDPQLTLLADAELIASAVNALPRLLDLAEEALRLRAVADAARKIDNWFELHGYGVFALDADSSVWDTLKGLIEAQANALDTARPDDEAAGGGAAEGGGMSQLTFTIERDSDGEYVVANDGPFVMFGGGPTLRAAFADYLSTLEDYRDILAESTANGTLGKNQVGHLAIVRDLLGETTEQPR